MNTTPTHASESFLERLKDQIATYEHHQSINEDYARCWKTVNEEILSGELPDEKKIEKLNSHMEKLWAAIGSIEEKDLDKRIEWAACDDAKTKLKARIKKSANTTNQTASVSKNPLLPPTSDEHSPLNLSLLMMEEKPGYIRMYIAVVNPNYDGKQKDFYLQPIGKDGEKSEIVLQPKKVDGKIHCSFGTPARSLGWHQRYRFEQAIKGNAPVDAPIRSVLVETRFLRDKLFHYTQPEGRNGLNVVLKIDGVDRYYPNQFGVTADANFVKQLNDNADVSSFQTIAPQNYEQDGSYNAARDGEFVNIRQLEQQLGFGERQYLLPRIVDQKIVKNTPFVSVTDGKINHLSITDINKLYQYNKRLFEQLAGSEYIHEKAKTSFKSHLTSILDMNHLTPANLLRNTDDNLSLETAWGERFAESYLNHESTKEAIHALMKKFASKLKNDQKLTGKVLRSANVAGHLASLKKILQLTDDNNVNHLQWLLEGGFIPNQGRHSEDNYQKISALRQQLFLDAMYAVEPPDAFWVLNRKNVTKNIIEQHNTLFGPLSVQEYWDLQLFNSAQMIKNKGCSFLEAIYMAAHYEYSISPEENSGIGQQLLGEFNKLHNQANNSNISPVELKKKIMELILTKISNSNYCPPKYDSESTIKPLSGEDLPAANTDNINTWLKPVINAGNNDAPTRFDGQIILQIENDPVVMDAAVKLVSKHPGNSVLIQLNAIGGYRVIYGDLKKLAGNLRWQVVGHGRGGENGASHQTFGGSRPIALASGIKRLSSELSIEYGINSKPTYISLVGCSLTDKDNSPDYARQFAHSLDELAIRVDIGARRTQVSVNSLGQKLTQDNQGYWHHKISDDKLVLSWNKQGELVSATDLAARLERAMIITDALASGKTQYLSLDATQRAALTDFFQRSDGTLDFKQLILTTIDKIKYQQWRNQAYQLLQLQDAYAPLGLSGQAALQHSQSWNVSQVESISALLSIGMKNSGGDVKVNTHIAPQGLYVGNNSAVMRGMTLAWFNAGALGENGSQRFLSKMLTYIMINEQKAAGPLSDTDAEQSLKFRQLFNELKFDSIAHQDVFTPLSKSAFNGEIGNYLFTAGEHVLALSVRPEKGLHAYYLYDPDAGEMRLSGANALQTRAVLDAALKEWRASKNSLPGSQGGAEEVIYKVDLRRAKEYSSAWDNLQTFLESFYSEPQRLALVQDVIYDKVTLPARILNKMGVRIDGKPLSAAMLARRDFASKLHFDPEQLSHYLRNANHTDPTVIKAVQFLQKQITARGDGLLMHGRDPDSTAMAVKLLQDINLHMDGDQIKPTLWSALQKTPTPDHGFSGWAGMGIQGYGYFSGFNGLMKCNQMLESVDDEIKRTKKDEKRVDELKKRREELELERNLAASSFGSNFAVDGAQYGLEKMGTGLAQKGPGGVINVVRNRFEQFITPLSRITGVSRPTTAMGLKMAGSRFGQISFNASMKLAKFGGPVLGALSSGFDIYNAYQAFSKLASTTDPKARQDLIVSGSFSVAGATIGIGTAILFAVGGTAAAVGGPIGIGIGLLLIAAGQFYSAVRQVEEIKKYTNLTAMQKFRVGWQAFWGLELELFDANKHNEEAHKQTMQKVREDYERLRMEGACTLLRNNSNINAIYYSSEQITLKEHAYKKLMGTPFLHPNPLILGPFGSLIFGPISTVKDKIKPNEIHEVRKDSRIPLTYKDIFEKDSDFKFYTPDKLQSIDDTVDVNQCIGNGDIVVTQQYVGHRQKVGQLVDQKGNILSNEPDLRSTDYRSVMGDFNGDGRRDIGYFSLRGFYLLLADKKGGYGQVQYVENIDAWLYGYELGGFAHPRRLVGDINGDGRDDIILFPAIFIQDSTALCVLLGQKNGSFEVSRRSILSNIVTQLDSSGPVIGDVNGDGYADLVSFSEKKIKVYYGTEQGKFSDDDTPLLSKAGFYAHQLTGDVNGDGRADVVSLTKEGKIHTLLGSKNQQEKFIALDEQDYPLAVWKMYSGMSEIVSEMYDAIDTINGRGGFESAQIELEDINGDGYADLILIRNDGSYIVTPGQKDGQFGPVVDGSQREENGKKVAYCPNRLAVRGEERILGVSKGLDGKPALLSVNKAGEVNAHTFSPTRMQDTIDYLQLGDGNDKAVGNQERRNSFEVAGGIKKFTGGCYADSFFLMGKPAAGEKSVLNGGDNPLSTTPLKDNDTVIAAVANNEGYEIDLNAGYARYKNNREIIAKLLNIEHAQGHKETDDILIGDDLDNVLNGVGGEDKIIGNGGNDVLMLQAGTACGGVGIDSYHILQNSRDRDVSIVVEETPETGGLSNILLDYKAEKIEAISLQDDDILLTLLNDNKKRTTLTLRNIYSGSSTDKKLKNGYLLYTQDGLIISLVQNADGSWPSFQTVKAEYRPILDRNWQVNTQGAKPEEIQVQLQFSNEQGRGQVTITVAGEPVSKIVLPEFISLTMADTPFNDGMLGDNNSNLLLSTQGNDTLTGKGDSDHYIIEADNTDREIIIDNSDDNLAQDTLSLPLSMEMLHVEQKGNDIVLSHRDLPQSYPKVRILNFMEHARYRHLMLQDEIGMREELILNDSGRVSLGKMQVTAGNDRVIIWPATAPFNHRLGLLAGNDIFIGGSDGGYTVDGGEGDDAIWVEAGNNTLIGGAGNDHLYGGEGDDVYLYASGDGHDRIIEKGGHDSLKFTSEAITRETLWLEKVGEDLQIRILGQNPGDSIVIQGYYADTKHKIETIEAGGCHLTGGKIDQLVRVMSDFPHSGDISALKNNSTLSASINELWSAAGTQ